MQVDTLLDGLVLAMTFISGGVVLYGLYVCIAYFDSYIPEPELERPLADPLVDPRVGRVATAPVRLDHMPRI